jgi:hypothetical protein
VSGFEQQYRHPHIYDDGDDDDDVDGGDNDNVSDDDDDDDYDNDDDDVDGDENDMFLCVCVCLCVSVRVRVCVHCTMQKHTGLHFVGSTNNALAGVSWRDNCTPKQLTCPTDVLLCFLSFTSTPLSVSLSLPLSRLNTPSLLSLLSLPPCAHANEHNIRDNLTHSADSCACFQRVENMNNNLMAILPVKRLFAEYVLIV